MCSGARSHRRADESATRISPGVPVTAVPKPRPAARQRALRRQVVGSSGAMCQVLSQSRRGSAAQSKGTRVDSRRCRPIASLSVGGGTCSRRRLASAFAQRNAPQQPALVGGPADLGLQGFPRSASDMTSGMVFKGTPDRSRPRGRQKGNTCMTDDSRRSGLAVAIESQEHRVRLGSISRSLNPTDEEHFVTQLNELG